MNNSVVYIHIGDNIPEYIYDSIYQTLLINNYSCKIYIILNDNCITDFFNKIDEFNIELYIKTIINIIPISILSNEISNNYIKFTNDKYKKIQEFRDNFWINTTLRFFYLHNLIKMFNLTNIYHIENDVMMYIPFYEISIKFKLNENSDIYMIQDSDNRVIPSLLFLPNVNKSVELVDFLINTTLNTNEFINDMTLLGLYKNKKLFPIFPNNDYSLIFDGAAIGQYIGGVDKRNINTTRNVKYDIIQFINETSIFKPNTCKFHKTIIEEGYKIFTCEYNNKIIPVVNLHIHSKELFRYSSIFKCDYENIISGDRILGLCDYVLCTRDIYNFHQNIDKFNKNIIIINDFKNINYTNLNKYFKELNKKVVKIFVYTHILQYFQTYILNHLDTSIKYILYTHNSDHPFDITYKEIIEHPNIKHIYAQNANYYHNKISLLPIGIANSMWPHGNIEYLFDIMKKSYNKKKTKNVYVNINPHTFPYRQVVLDILKEKNWEIHDEKLDFKNYLDELSKYMFCLCVRGNGYACHRDIEALYLGVIPIIINNEYTNCDDYVKYLINLNIPIYVVKNINQIDYSIFTKELYDKIMKTKTNNTYLDINYYT